LRHFPVMSRVLYGLITRILGGSTPPAGKFI